MKKILIPILILAILAIPATYFGKKVIRDYQYSVTHSTLEPITLETEPSANNSFPKENTITTTTTTTTTEEINLKIDFFSQAPYADWSMPYQEACEEASLILAYNFVQGITMNKEEFHIELLKMIDWETAHFGSYEHTTVDETAEMLDDFYDFQNYKILTDPSIDNLKNELASGNPIVAPFAGRELGNPNFTGEGPYYHMLVIRGYDEEYFITNDVGTRLGENYQYTHDVLMNALHDWHDTDISTEGEKKVLVLLGS